MSDVVPINWVQISVDGVTRLLRAEVPGGYLYRQDTMQGSRVIASSITYAPREVMTVQDDAGKHMLVVRVSDGKNIGQSQGGA